MVTRGRIVISTKSYPFSTLFTIPSAWTSKSVYSNFEYSTIARNVVVKQLATALSNKSSGVHLPYRPPNAGGEVKWIALGAELDFARPVRPEAHQATTRNRCTSSMVLSPSFVFRTLKSQKHQDLSWKVGTLR
jgi:hypothetical protein